MQISKWIAKARKSVRPKSSKSPRLTHIFVLSVVALIAIAGLVLAAHQPTPAKTVTTGFCYFDRNEAGEGMDAELRAFLEAGPPPVVFTLGSSAPCPPG